MSDNRRCLLHNDALDIWLEGIGEECDAPGARPIATTADTSPQTPNQSASDPTPEDLSAPDPPAQENPPEPAAPTATTNGTSHVTPYGGPRVNRSDVPPSTPDGTIPDLSLQQQYLRPLNPLPDYRLRDILLSEGVPPAELDSSLLAIVRNEPPSGQPHPTMAQNNRMWATTLFDPIDPFTGRYLLTVSDLVIPSPGMDLHLVRSYASGKVAFGPFGYNWDHSYNVYLRELDAGAVAVRTGSLREEIYRPDPTDRFEPPLGVFRLLERLTAGESLYTLSDREGVRYEFDRPTGWPHPEKIPLVRIRDPHNNLHTLEYDSDGRIASVSDGLGRSIAFLYGTCGLLEYVRDHTGRTWSYTHDEAADHLIAATTPPTAEYPEGLTTRYEYEVDRAHPALRHNIVRVIDPAGEVACENVYGRDPTTTDFNRVVCQRVGDFEAQFAASELQIVQRESFAVNAPTLRVEIVDPGNYYVYTFNFRGDLLDQRFRLISDKSRRLVARTFRYDQQGNLTERWEPTGTGVVRRFDAVSADPRARGNLLRTEFIAGSSFAVPSRVLSILTYDDSGLRLRKFRNALGKVTTYFYDSDTDPSGRGDLVRIEYPDATLPDGRTQHRAEEFAYDARGLLIEHRTGEGVRHLFEYEGSGVDAGYLRRAIRDADGVTQTTAFEYDVWGNRVAETDGNGRRIEQSIDELGLVVSRRAPASDGGFDEVRFRYDARQLVIREEWPRGEYEDGTITDPIIAHEYEYDVLGHIKAATFGTNTARPARYTFTADEAGRIRRATDPLGRVTTQKFDERGLLLERTEAAGTPLEARWRVAYQRDGRCRSVTDAAGYRIDFVHDAWGRLTEVKMPGGSEARRTQVTIAYDELDQMIGESVKGVRADGSVGVLAAVEIERDERGRPVRRIADTLASTVFYDADERPVRRLDQRGAEVTVDYDGLNRAIRAVDGAGNAVERQYDAAGRLILLSTTEARTDGSLRSYESTLEYDGAGRLSRHTDPLGRQSTRHHDARGLPVRIVDQLGRTIRIGYDLDQQARRIAFHDEADAELAVHRYETDSGGRLVAYEDPLGITTRWTYDDRDRQTAVIYADGREQTFKYGSMFQVSSETLPSGTVLDYEYGDDGGLARIDTTPGPGLQPVAPLSIDYDGLRRVVSLTQGSVELKRDYDSLARLTLERLDGAESRHEVDDAAGVARFRFPDGRVDSIELDAFGRPTRRVLASVGASGATGPLTNGAELVRYDYHGTDQPAERVTLDCVACRYGYDHAGRLVGLEHAVGGTPLAAMTCARDAGDRQRVVWRSPAPNVSHYNRFDGLDHLVAAETIETPAPGSLETQGGADAAIAAAQAAPATDPFGYVVDADDSRTEATSADAAERYDLNACRHVTLLERSGTNAGSWSFDYDDDGHLIRDDRHRYVYDAIGRLVEVVDLSSARSLVKLEYDPAGRLMASHRAGRTSRHHHHGSQRVQTTGPDDEILQYTHGIRSYELVLASNGANLPLLSDPSESLLAVCDEAGSVLERYAYDPFGRPAVWDGDGTVERATTAVGLGPRFATYHALPGELYAAGARVYVPALGRFLQPDPLGFAGSPDLYGYAAQDPVNLFDPTGEAGVLVGLAVIAGIGLAAGLGINAIHQFIAIEEGAQPGWEWGQFIASGAAGAGGAVLLAVVPEAAVPLALMGIDSGHEEYQAGHKLTGGFDMAVSALPFLLPVGRQATFGPGTIWGRGPVDGLGTRLGRFQQVPGIGTVRPPGVRIRQTEFARNGGKVVAWEKSVSTRVPVLRQWAQKTIEAQQRGLEDLRGAGVDAAEVLQPYRPGGSLVIEDAGVPATVALENSSLRPAYREYYRAAAQVASGRVGRLPLVGRLVGRIPEWGRIGMHDVRAENIGYTPGRGFVVFDPAIEGTGSGLLATLSFYGDGANSAPLLDLLGAPSPQHGSAGAPK